MFFTIKDARLLLKEGGSIVFLEDFSAGSFEKQTGFQSFIPSNINKQWQWKTPKINALLETANLELGGLKSYSDMIPNIDLYIWMHIKVEANKSSRIEGTHTTLEEDMLPIQDLNPEKRDDAREVQNYIRALQHGVNRISVDKFPISSRLIKEIHKELLQGARGKNKTPGEYRTSQNWIGGSMPSNAMYVPPSHIYIPELITGLEQFIHNDTIMVPQLIRIAMIHYQFESIHPFLDGNGRTGRILVPLLLLNSEMLVKPCFYISDYFETHRTEYYDALNRVRLGNDMIGWISFFLEASISTARSARIKFGNAMSFVEETNRVSSKITGSSENVRSILDCFYKKPVQSSPELSSLLHISKQTVNRILTSMSEEGIIQENTGNTRNKIFIMNRYLDIFK